MTDPEIYAAEIRRLTGRRRLCHLHIGVPALVHILSALQLARQHPAMNDNARANFLDVGLKLQAILAEESRQLVAIIDKGWADNVPTIGVDVFTDAAPSHRG